MPVPQYPTNDPYLASFLLSAGSVLTGHERLAPKRVEFRFEANATLHELLRIYWSSRPVQVVPLRLFAALQTLKSRSLMKF